MQTIISRAAASITANANATDRAAMQETVSGIEYIGAPSVRSETRAAAHEATIARLNAQAASKGYMLV